ncbi:MAG: hypothetical protein ABWX68_12175 [Arthrobacter sp.]|uniref:hypothetical protein n=1 Tax=Arthrobacter sp. TaxID=1667 RepID=UPI00349451A6
MAAWNDEWETERWRAAAHAWISGVLASYGLGRAGPAEPRGTHLWSTEIAVPTDHGPLVFRANCPGQLAEAAVASAAAALAPAQLVMPLAVDAPRGWMLSPDYGQALRPLPAADERSWTRLVRDFARVQLDLLPFGDELFDAGLLQLDPAWLPAHVEDQVALHASLPPGHPLRLAEGDAAELRSGMAEVRRMCAFLAAGPVPLSLDHHDLRRGAALVPTAAGEPLRFTGLGGAYWAHPFSSLGVPVREMCKELSTTPADPRVARVVAAYLERWGEYGTVDELRPYVEPAVRLGRLQEHDTWMRILAGAADADVARYARRALRPLAELTRPVLG